MTVHWLIFIWLGSIPAVGGKMVWDQYKLLKLYRTKANPPYPILPGEDTGMFHPVKEIRPEDPLSITRTIRQSQITFSRHQDHPEVAKLAARVRAEFFAGLTIEIGGFFLIAAFLFVLKPH